MEELSDKAKKTRTNILRAAEKLLLNSHIDKTPVSEIVKEAGVAKGTFYLYFESKDELAWSLVMEVMGAFEEEMEKLQIAPVSKQYIDYLITRLIQLAVKNHKLFEVIHHEKFLEFVDYNNKQQDIEAYYMIALKKWLDRGVAQAIIKIDNTDFYAKFIFISLHEVMERILLGNLDYQMEDAEEHLKQIIYRIIGL